MFSRIDSKTNTKTSLNIVVNLNMSVRQATLVEQQMTAVERVLQTAMEVGC